MFLNCTVTMVESSPFVKWSGLQIEWGINVTERSQSCLRDVRLRGGFELRCCQLVLLIVLGLDD